MKYNYNYDDDVRKNIYITMRKINWWYEKKIKICEKKNDDCGDNYEKNKYIKFEDQE